MWKILALAFIGSASAQIPSLGWCPDFQPMANFSMNRFLGTWYEAERYFTVSELASRCVTTNYVSTPEGRILVANEIINYLTGVKRVMEGSLQMIGREGEGRIMVKYSSLPLPYDYEYSILDTDYDSFAVMWSCSGLGPVHTQSAWLLTRDRLASSTVMQRAYAVLDKYKISRAFFVKTSQADCTVLPDPAASPIAGKNAGLAKEAVKELDAEIPALEPVKMSVLRAIAVFLCGLRLCRSQLAFPGNCPDVSAMTDFDPSRYTGKWYEAEKYFFLFEFGGKCVTANYDTKDDGVMTVTNKQLSSFTGIQSEIDGEATQISRSDEGKLSVRFPSLPVNVAAPYWVVDTDYDNYSIIWSCNDFGLFHTRNAWILTRERNPSLSVMEKVYKSLDKNNINRSYFLRTDQSNCIEDNDS
ncbi:uncharacterized protein LOC113518406 [Galleria mellonella]|uniref:Uncharacterized protein LOC113518406 n=1 Tax=Galleria mellonella TaxID=7137 RepID=A0ABM3MBJ7_GALME|nr:uncharacterized protein LOC113518406 [Galleria mellonella]